MEFVRVFGHTLFNKAKHHKEGDMSNGSTTGTITLVRKVTVACPHDTIDTGQVCKLNEGMQLGFTQLGADLTIHTDG